jgi:hypoxanthine phosphoribosyltransferase
MTTIPDARLVFSEAEVEQAYRRMAAGLQPFVSAGDCVLIGILMGGMIPTAQLAVRLTGDFLLDCCQVSRYRGGVKGGELHWILEPKVSLEGKTVLLVDDIYDEGITLANVISVLLDRGASHVVSAVLIKKRHDRANVHFSPDIVGLEVDDHYVFGCGMDYQHHWRHLPAIYALTDE